MKINTDPENYPENHRGTNFQDKFDEWLEEEVIDDVRDPLYNLDIADLLDTRDGRGQAFFPEYVEPTTTTRNNKTMGAIRITTPRSSIDIPEVTEYFEQMNLNLGRLRFDKDRFRVW